MEGNSSNASDSKITWLPYMLVIAIVLIVGVAVFMSGGDDKKRTAAQQSGKAATTSGMVSPDISEATYRVTSKPDFKEQKVKLPHSSREMGTNAKFRYEFTLNWKEGSPTALYVVADDCLDKVTVNGASLTVKPEEKCGWRIIRNFDLKKQLKPGKNKVLIEGMNEGGAGGLSVYTSK